jgi:hypothetical protein
MKIISTIAVSLFALAEAHSHADEKPSGWYYGFKNKSNARNTKVWNEMEIQINFGENTMDIEWYYGMNLAIGIPKQTFVCSNVPFTFDGKNVIVKPDAGTCLGNINAKFPTGFGLDTPHALPLMATGEVKFTVADGKIELDMYPIKSKLAKVPSGVDGRAPEKIPEKRTCDHDHDHDDDDHDHDHSADGSSTKAPEGIKADAASKSGGNNAGAKLGSVFVSAAAIVFAGLFM